MRQFLLAGNAAYGATLPLEAGKVAITTLINGVETISADGAAVTDKFYINLGRAEHGPVIIPAYKKHFSFVKGTYQAGSAYSGEVTIPELDVDGNYTLILFKKGLKFNERNRWTATTHAKVGETAASVAARLGKYFEANATNLDITVEVEDATITITGNKAGVDFKLAGADELIGLAVTETNAVAPYGDAAYVADLADKAAADAGFEYTYKDLDINPGYPLNPLKAANSQDNGFTIFTLHFAVPREVKTRDEVVHQIVQVAFPTGAAAIATFETVCEAIAGVE